MGLTIFWAKAMKGLDWKDIGLIKLASAALALMVAKLWAPLLSLDWYWYGLILALASIRPLKRAYWK